MNLQNAWSQIAPPATAVQLRFHDPAIPEVKDQHWMSSRQCLASVIQKLNSSPEKTLLSLSHGTQRSAAIGCKKDGLLQGVGIDIEDSNRPLKEGAWKKFCKREELDLGVAPLALWTIKEACYKAYSLENRDFPIHYHLQTWNPETGLGRVVLENEPELEFRIYSGMDGSDFLSIAFCYLPSDKS